MIDLVFLFIGLFAGLVIDIIWWVKPVLSKSDKFQAHEHYHVSLELIILFVVTSYLTDSPVSLLILGAGIAFLLGEWDQLKEIKNHKVVPGHPFAYGSTHFKSSCVIGGILLGILIALTTVTMSIPK